MSFLGRYPKGGIVPLLFVTSDGSDVPVVPDAAPSIIVYQAGTPLASFKVPSIDQNQNTGLFLYQLFLGALYTTGLYQVLASWIISSTSYAKTFDFEVVTAGDLDGDVIAMGVVNNPQAAYALLHGRSGRILKRRNPRAL